MMVIRCASVLPLILLVSLTFSQSNAQRLRNTGYTAAVVEFSPVESLTDPPSLILSVNLGEYEKFIVDAKSQGADIIVFPEYALTGTSPSENRSLARDFSQIVPEPELASNPCVDNNSSMEFEAMRRLSCFARTSSIYLVVNLLEKTPCEGCAADNLLIFNTNVAFDRTGAVVARYRKFNLFAEFALNQTAEADIATFTTDWGTKFGLITCFDIMFEHPAVTLVQDYDVTDLIFPTAWIQELPFLTGVQTQAMWSYAMEVNMLASGYNAPRSGSGGSGIFQGKLGVITQILPWETTSLSLIGKIPTKSSANYHKLQSRATVPYYYQEDLTNYKTLLIELTNDIKSYKLCHNNLCCNVEISGDLFDTTVFRIIVFNGVRTFGGGYYKDFKIQTCGIIRCKLPDDPVKNCALDLNNIALNVHLNHIKINANFDNDAIVGPNTVDGVFTTLTADFIKFNKIKGPDTTNASLELVIPINENILTFALWGRVYPKNDNPQAVIAYTVGGILVFSVAMMGIVALNHHFNV